MQKLKPGDLVIVINSDYNEKLIGSVGSIENKERFVEGYDISGKYISGYYLVVDLPGMINRFKTTLWYFKSNNLIKISPDKFVNVRAREPQHIHSFV